MKKILKGLLPPILIEWSIKKLKSNKTFPSYQEALDACGNLGYQDSKICDVVTAKTMISSANIISSRSLELNSLRTLIGVSALFPSDTLRVIDFGGGAGQHYSIVRAVLSDKFDIKWNVVETPTMVRYAAQRLSNSSLNFFDNIESAKADLGHVDLAFSSGALQYTSDPLMFLAKILAIRADNVFITRVGLNHNDENITTIQKSFLSENGPGPLPDGFEDCIIKYPLTLVSKKMFENQIRETYSIQFFTEEEQNAYSVKSQSFNVYGFFCKIKK